jgi:hypothetical protein
MSEELRPAVVETVARLFGYYSEFQILGYYFRTAPPNLATLHFLAMAVPADRVDGVTVHANDEQVLVVASELAGVSQPRPGDYMVQSSNGLRRDVITAHLDVTGTLWTLVTRKVFT